MRKRLCRAHALVPGLLLVAGAHAQITEFSVPTPGSRPYTIVAGRDEDLWFTESIGNKIARITTAGTITEFPVPTAGSGPYGIAVGRDGNIWFTERFANQIARFNPATGQFAEFRIPTPFSQPWEIALAPDGNLWFTEEDAGLIGRITPQGVIREFTPPSCCFPTGIIAGQDGRMWFTLEIGDQIGAIQPSGAMTMYQIQSVQVLPWDIVPGLDGGLWFTELAGRALGRISVSGQISELPVPGPFSGIAGVAADADGRMWFTENDTDHVGAMDATGAVVQLLDTSAGARPLGIALGSDGNMWFTEADTNKIGRVDLSAPNRVHVLVLDAGFSPPLRTVALGQSLRWIFLGPNVHSIVDASGLGLFDSGPRGFVSYYTLTCIAACTVVYRDRSGITPPGSITIPVRLPAAATTGVPFQVIWSLVPAPAGYAFDVQVLEPGAVTFVDWTSGSSRKGSYTARVPGAYQFRSRLRKTSNGLATLYSMPASVLVQ